MESGTHLAFGDLLRRYRVAAGLTQEELAERADLSAKAISMLECGVTRAPHRDTVALLAGALGLADVERAALEAAVQRRRGPAPHAPPLSNLPLPPTLAAPPTPLIGREGHVAAVAHLLRHGEARLLTLTGPPGVGKTRLALEVAATVRDQFADGITVVALAPLRDPDLVASSIAQALELRDTSSRPLRDSLVAFLHEQQRLLLLDNFEHMTAAAPLILELLAACPRLHVLLTSRVVLHVRGEQQIPVPPLELADPAQLPPLEALAHFPAVALFIQRARAAQPDFDLTAANAATVAEICRRLDGLPLAIELAAARITVLPPRTLLARLAERHRTRGTAGSRSLEVLTYGPRDLPARQQTLRGAIAWSYDLLDAREQAIFRRLAIFVGGCTLEAAQAVCASSAPPLYPAGAHAGPGADGLDVLDALASLLHKSLVWAESGTAADDGSDEEPRFGMLETLREFGLEGLAASGEMEALHARHAAYYLALAEAAEPELMGPQQAVWLARLEEEHDNLRAALEWTRMHEEVATGLRLAAALWRFWLTRGYVGEGYTWLERLLSMAGDGQDAEVATAPSTDSAAHAQASEQAATRGHAPHAAAQIGAARAKALNGAGTLAMAQGNYERAAALHEQSLVLRRRLGDTRGIAQSLNNLGLLAREQGDYARATVLYENSVALYRELGDAWGIAAALSNLGGVAYYQGDYARATALYEESLALQRDLDHTWGVANVLSNLGNVAQQQGDFERAMSLYEDSLALRRDLGDKGGIAATLNNLGSVAYDRGAYARAMTLYEQSVALFRQLDDKTGTAGALDNLGMVLQRQGDYARATALHEESLALERELGDTWGIATALNNLGLIAHAQGDETRAAALLAESLTLFQSMNSTRGVAKVLEALAEVLCTRHGNGQRERVERAARLCGAAAALRETIGVPLPPAERAAFERTVATGHAALGAEAWDAAWVAGRSLTLEQAIAEAVREDETTALARD